MHLKVAKLEDFFLSVKRELSHISQMAYKLLTSDIMSSGWKYSPTTVRQKAVKQLDFEEKSVWSVFIKL